MKTKHKYYTIAELKSWDAFIEVIAFVAAVLLPICNDNNWNYFLIFPGVQMLSATLWLFISNKKTEPMKTALEWRTAAFSYYFFTGIVYLFLIDKSLFFFVSWSPFFLGLFALILVVGVILSFKNIWLLIDEVNFYAAISESLKEQ